MNTLLSRYLKFLDKNYKIIILLILLIIIFFGYFLKDTTFDTNWRIWYTKDTLNKYDMYVDEFSYDDTIILAFKDENGIFNKKALSTIKRVTNKLQNTKYISKVISLTNYQYVYSMDDELVVEDFIKKLDNKEIAYKRKIAKNEPNLINRLLDKNLTSTMIVAKLSNEVNYLKYDPTHELMKQIYKIVDEEKQYNNYTIHINGGPEVTMAFERLAKRDIILFVPLIFITIILLLYMIFRNYIGVIIPISIVILTILLTVSIESFLGHRLNNFTANIPLYIIAIGLADTIHIYSTYTKLYEEDTDNYQLVLETLNKNIKPLFLTSLTTSIGFFSLTFSPIEPVKLLGETISIAVVIAFFLTIILVPIFLLKLNIKKSFKKEIIIFNFKPLNRFVERYYRYIIFLFLVLLSISLYGIKYVKIDSNLIKYFDENVDIRKSLSFIENSITGPVIYEVLIDSKKSGGVKEPKFLKTIEKFKYELQTKFPDIKKTFSLIDIIKQLNMAFHENNHTKYTIPTSKEEVAQYLLLYELSLSSGSSIQDLKSIDDRRLKLSLYVNLLGTQQDLKIFEWIESWWSETPYSIEINGSYALFAKMQNSVSKTLINSLYFTLSFLIIIFILFFRRLSRLYIYLLPNILPIALAFGIMGWLGISMDLGIAISLAIILSIAVDDTIHFLSKFYENKRPIKESMEYAYRYAGVGIIFTTTIIAISFGLFAFSDFMPNRYFGIITSTSLILALVLDLLLLPSLLYFSYRRSINNE